MGIQVKDQAEWDKWVANNKSDYGSGLCRFAERWACLMQDQIAQGRSVADVAASTSSEANTGGITRFMYGCAVSRLADSWVHGEELRRWHNLDTQLGDEGERANEAGTVLNPAILNTGPK